MLLILVLSFTQQTQAQKGYSIKVKLENITDTVCYLTYTYGDTYMVVDTSEVKNGAFSFKGDEKLPEALYVVAGSSKNKLIDLIISNDTKFSFKGDSKNLNETVKIKGSKENKKFYKYIQYISRQNKLMQSLRDSISRVSNDSVLKSKLTRELTEMDANVSNYQHDFIQEDPTSFLSKFILASMPVQMPQELDSASREARYNYYKNHYWDHVDFSDDRMLNTPFLYSMWERYLDKTLYPIPDSINKEIDLLFDQMLPSGEMYNYLLGKTIYKYETSKVMGYDAVFVHIALNYFKKGKTAKYNKTVVKNIIERGETLEKILIGKIAPNIVAQDSSKQIKQLRDIKADYTVLVFWDSECGHCKKELPIINKFYIENKDKYNLEVYAVSTDSSVVKWKNFINEKEYDWINVLGKWSAAPFYKDVYDIYSTPVLYMMDENKKIIGKRFGAENIEKVIEFDQRVNKKGNKTKDKNENKG